MWYGAGEFGDASWERLANWRVGGAIPTTLPGNQDTVQFDGNATGNAIINGNTTRYVGQFISTAQWTKSVRLGDGSTYGRLVIQGWRMPAGSDVSTINQAVGGGMAFYFDSPTGSNYASQLILDAPEVDWVRGSLVTPADATQEGYLGIRRGTNVVVTGGYKRLDVHVELGRWETDDPNGQGGVANFTIQDTTDNIRTNGETFDIYTGNLKLYQLFTETEQQLTGSKGGIVDPNGDGRINVYGGGKIQRSNGYPLGDGDAVKINKTALIGNATLAVSEFSSLYVAGDITTQDVAGVGPEIDFWRKTFLYANNVIMDGHSKLATCNGATAPSDATIRADVVLKGNSVFYPGGVADGFRGITQIAKNLTVQGSSKVIFFGGFSSAEDCGKLEVDRKITILHDAQNPTTIRLELPVQGGLGGVTEWHVIDVVKLLEGDGLFGVFQNVETNRTDLFTPIQTVSSITDHDYLWITTS